MAPALPEGRPAALGRGDGDVAALADALGDAPLLAGRMAVAE